ncbi:hypothetical protein QRX50_31465 [Amycolatopsis carbonis]|uniref:Uncharacterized protein n=1 Tax=Amycolatopsis carbonis TaxID=715471 RepID=A0A9Y2IAG3_9PSEU|nr:hypothetical protein [Amycolatopsis sp. 2-15]WIX75979.1 hypothetical protein QRX50_31465 [Amycolatopsis sp. 2-15]
MSTPRGIHKDLHPLIAAAQRQGWELRKGGKHWALLSPDGTDRVVFGNSPGDQRTVANTRSLLRQKGVDV